jgi:uncharacterized membrane protein YesL
MAIRARPRAPHQPRPWPTDLPDLEDDPAESRPVRLPSVRSTARLALSDLYFNSWRLAPANLVWGALLVVALLAGPGSILGLALLILLAVPTAGLHRMGALIARGEAAAFSDFVDGMRRTFAQALLAGAGAVGLGVVLTTNILVGLQSGNPVGWLISALALWGLVGLALSLLAFWPILADPRREQISFRRRLALAGMTVVGRPRRMAALAVVVAVILVISTILFAALLTASIAYVGVLSSRYVLPTVDELESRLIV